MSCVELELPFPISVNRLYPQNRRTGRRFTSREYAAWQRDAGWRIRTAVLRPLSYPVDVRIDLTPRDKRRRDADNHVKCVMDLMVKMQVIKDDSSDFVRDIHVVWRSPDRANPRATVTITASQPGGCCRTKVELAETV